MESNSGQRWEEFTMVIHSEVNRLWPLVKDRTLMPMDLCVAHYLMGQMDIRTGRIEVRTKDIAEELGLTMSQLTPAIKRLRAEHLLAKGLKGTGYFWMLNPHYWHVGGSRLHAMRINVFNKLVSD